MPMVSTNISYEHEEGGRGETSCFKREVEDLDIHDWLWYMMKVSELMGYDVKDIQVFTSDGKAFRTEP
jgi:hypothetical protein